MGSNQGRYTGIQAQVNQQQGGIGVANFQPMDLSGIAKTIESIDNHIVKVQDANRTVDYLTLTEQLKAVDQEQSTFSSTIDKDGNLTLLDGTKQNYKDYLASAYEKKVQLVGDFKSKWKANRFQNDEMGVRIRSMQETMPIDRLQSEKAIELNLSQIQLVSTLEDISANPNLDFTQKIITMDNAIESTPMAFEQKQQSKRRYAGVAIEVAFKDHENYLGQLSTELEKQSGGNAELYLSLLKQSLESPEYQKRQEALTQGLNVLAEVSQVDDIAIKSLQGLTAQEIQQRQAIVKQESEQNQRRLNQYSRIAMQDANYAVQLALSGQGDSKAVSNAMVHLSQLIKNKILASDDKVQLNEMVKELVEAKKIGNQLASNPMGIDVGKISNPAIAGEALRIQQSYIEEQKRLAEQEVEKQQKQIDQAFDIYSTGTGVLSPAQFNKSLELGVDPQSQGYLGLTDQQLNNIIVENLENPMRAWVISGAKEGTIGEEAFWKKYTSLAGISNEVSVQAIRSVSDTPQDTFRYLDALNKASVFNTKFSKTKDELQGNLIDSGFKGDKNAYLASTRGILDNSVFQQIVWGETYKQTNGKVFSLKEGGKGTGEKIDSTFQQKYNENYIRLSKNMMSIKKNEVSLNRNTQIAMTRNYKLPMPKMQGVSLAQANKTNWNSQPLQIIGIASAIAGTAKQLDVTVGLTSGYRHIPTSSKTEHGGYGGRYAIDVADNGNDRQVQLQLYATLKGINAIGNNVKIGGAKSRMFTYAKLLESGRDLPYLTKRQNAELKNIIMKSGGVFNEGSKADSHFHVSGVVSSTQASRYVPSTIKKSVRLN